MERRGVVPIKDYSEARYWAISDIGYGKGFTAYEAVTNYVNMQLRNFPASQTVFKTRSKWKAALEPGGEAAAQVWKAPAGWTGFVMGMGSKWTREVDGKTEYRDFEAGDRVTEVAA